MKKTLLATVWLILTVATLSAQAPQLINYQAVARNSAGDVLANQTVTVRFTIHANTPTGAIAHMETDTLTTNQFGLFTTAIGQHSLIPGGFAGIAWGYSPKYLQVELDPTGGTNFSDMGTTQILSVPYALYAETSGDNNWLKDGNNIYNANSGYVGIGTALPDFKLHVVDSTEQGEVAYANVENSGDGAARLRLTTKGDHYSYLNRNPNVSSGTINTIPTNNMLEMYNDGGDMMIDVYLHNIYFATNGYTNNMAITPTGIGIGTNTPAPSAAVDISSTTGALLLPRLTLAQRDALTPVAGMTIYNTDYDKFQGYTVHSGSSVVNDPSVTTISPSNNFGACRLFSQTFTAANNGSLNKISVYAYASGGPNPIRYRLRTGNTPGAGAILDSIDITVPNTAGWMDIVFTTHPLLTAGQYYQLEINADQSATHCTWMYTSDIDYTGGEFYEYNDNPPFPGWSVWAANHDLNFQVYQNVVTGGPGWVDLH